MPAVLLIRHGQNSFVGKRLAGRLPDVHLNEKGLQQAEYIAARLKGAPIKAIYSSPLERTIETAGPLAGSLGLEVSLAEGLLEVDFGGWQGKTMRQMQRMKMWKQVQEEPSRVRFPQGESFVEAQARIVGFLDSLREKHEEQEWVACFSHCDAIRLAICHYLDMPLDAFQRLSIDTASISLVYLGKKGRPGLLTMNQLSQDYWQMFAEAPHKNGRKAARVKEAAK
jgi:probable phosphomutase (TIGR03848 family)